MVQQAGLLTTQRVIELSAAKKVVQGRLSRDTARHRPAGKLGRMVTDGI